MAKVSLRIYNREIEGLIDQGHTDEAVAHCHHILKTFPKHLETYRMLGKAHLEAKRYEEAVDIFSRVLMAVPDDFVAHVGMSIIRDEQNKMDDAIWYMERAFEAQPSNAAIQGELQRLYGRRDGMEPPKIRMTRGALAHMYVQGELHSQAVAEIRAVLAEDPNRTDMQVLLARSYFRSNQKADASDMCSQLLKQYPYCFDANRIMLELLPSAVGAAENTQVYRARVIELDPYAALVKGSVFQVSEVADAAVNLEKLEYTGEEVPIGQEWSTSLGIGLEASSLAAANLDEQPDWLKSEAPSQFQASTDSQDLVQANDDIPDFLRAAGWAESKTPEQPTSIFDQEPAVSDDLVPADLPDWLKGQAPVGTEKPTEPQFGSEQSLTTPDWLTGLGEEESAQAESSSAQDAPDWLKIPGDSKLDESVLAQPGDVPDWLSGLDSSQAIESTQAQPGDAPDWLSGLDSSQAVESTQAQSGDAPDWLSGLDSSQAVESTQTQSDDVPDWLSGLGGLQTSESTQAQSSDAPDWLSGLDNSATPEQEQAQPSDTPEWLSGLEQPSSQTASEGLSADLPDWLSGLDDTPASEPVAAPTTNISDLFSTPSSEPVSDQVGDLPDWLEGLDELQPIQPITPSSSAASVESLGSTAQEQDDAVAWLESLAAKHGAKPEELVTDPNKRSDTPPEWVQQAQNINQQTTSQPSVESLGSTAQEQDDAVAWLESLAAKHGAKPEELVTDPNKRSDTPPEWVQQAQAAGQAETAASLMKEEDKQDISEQFLADFASASEIPATDETGMWLRELDEKEKQDEIAVPPASEATDIPDWVNELKPKSEQAEEPGLQRAEIPNWLLDAQQPIDSGNQFDFAEKEEPVAQSSDLPNWLSGVEDEVSANINENNLDDQDLSNWLSGLDNEPGLPFEPIPTPDSIMASATTPASNFTEEPVASKSDLPDWLSGIDSKGQEDVEEDLWKNTVDQESTTPASTLTEEPASVSLTADLPDWLQGVEEESAPIVDLDDGDDVPPWMHREQWEADEPQPLKPTSPSDWHPVEEQALPSVLDLVPVQEEDVEVLHKPVEPPPSQFDIEIPAPEQPVSKPVSVKKKSGLARQTQPEAQNIATVLEQAKGELDRGDIPTALDHYGKLIKKGKHLEETIRDLSESLYRYPVEVGIWQTLGDAYMRSNRLKEALEAYNKAEELIR